MIRLLTSYSVTLPFSNNFKRRTSRKSAWYYPGNADDFYRAQCTILAAETERAGVALDLTETPTPISTVGIDDDEYVLEFS